MRFRLHEIVEVSECSGLDSGMVGRVIDWRDVPMINKSGELVPDVPGHYKFPDKKKETPFVNIYNKTIIMFNNRLHLLDVNKLHWRIRKKDEKSEFNQHMLVVPYPINYFPEPGYALVVTGLSLNVHEASRDKWEAHKHRLHVNAGSGSIVAEDMKISSINPQWIPVSWKDIPNHIRSDFNKVVMKDSEAQIASE